MKLNITLKNAGLAPNSTVIQRIPEIKALLRSGRLPADLVLKLDSLQAHPPGKVSHLPMIAEAVRLHHARGPRLSEPLASLAIYTLAYLWEENDDVSDTWADGYDDDLRVMAQVARHAKREMGDLVLKSRRSVILERWSRGQ